MKQLILLALIAFFTSPLSYAQGSYENVTMEIGDSLFSENREAFITLTSEGYLAIHKTSPHRLLWRNNTQADKITYSNGILSLVQVNNGEEEVLWSTGTDECSTCKFVVDEDGQISIRDQYRRLLWPEDFRDMHESLSLLNCSQITLKSTSKSDLPQKVEININRHDPEAYELNVETVTFEGQGVDVPMTTQSYGYVPSIRAYTGRGPEYVSDAGAPTAWDMGILFYYKPEGASEFVQPDWTGGFELTEWNETSAFFVGLVNAGGPSDQDLSLIEIRYEGCTLR